MSSAAWKESISLDETNKIRISLGLKPIAEDAAPVKDADAIAAENYAKRREQEAKDRDTAALQSRIDRSLNARERQKKLIGVGLGADDQEGIKVEDGSAEGDDTKAWVRKQKKNAKILAAKREKEQAEADKRDQEAGLAKYGEDDLRGIKVSHGQEDFEEGEETILTLKDSRVLDDEDDELHNLNISENAKTAEALELKRKGKTAGNYTGLDDDEFIEGTIGEDGKMSVLKKYDEDIDGKQETGFRLGGPVADRPTNGAKGKGKAKEVEEKERVKLTMEYTKSFETDYLQEGEVGFKKSKTKKKKRPTRTAAPRSDDEMNVESTSASPSTSTPYVPRENNIDEMNLIDDDDLQAALARTRRVAAKKRATDMKLAMTLDTVQVKEESDDEDTRTTMAQRSSGDSSFVIDDMTEFVQRIGRNDVVKTLKVASMPSPIPRPTSFESATVVPVIKQEDVDVPISEMTTGGWGEAREDGEESDEDVTMADGAYEDDELRDVKPAPFDPNALTGTSGEALASNGLASTLNLLRQQGLMKTRTAEEMEQDRSRKEKASWLALKAKRERERQEEALKKRGDSRTQAEREHDNRMRDQIEARETMEAFNSYKPVVDIKYHDEHGRDLNTKEAWKHLSHAFHGKGSGRLNTEKHLKKIAEEKKREAMAAGDTALVMATAFALRAERTGSATMVLSTGNRGAAPISSDPLAGPKGKTLALSKKQGKAKAPSAVGISATVFSDIPMRALPLPASDDRRSGSPAVRAGFAPISSSSSSLSGPSIAMEESQSEKFIIPVAVKRKAAGDLGSLSNKR